MFDQLFEVLGTLESGLAAKTLKSPRQIKSLLTSAINQVTTMMQSSATLPKGSRSALTTLRRVMSDCLSGLNTGNISYKELRAVSRDKIGRDHALLKRLDDAEKKQPAELEFEDDDTEPMAASAVVKAKRKLLEAAMFKRYTNNLHGKSMVDMGRKVHGVMDSIETRWTRMSDKEVKKVDVEKLVATHTLEELMELSPEDMMGGTLESDELKELVSSYSKIMQKLPTNLHSSFQAFEFVVVPLFGALKTANGAARAKFLNAMQRSGVKVRMIGDHYPVFEKQYLLALDCKRLGIPKGLKTTKAGKTKTVNSPKADNGPDTIVGGVLDTINSVSPIKYVPASTQLISNPRNPDIKLMWIVPEKVRVAIADALHTSEVTWGLPADIEA